MGVFFMGKYVLDGADEVLVCMLANNEDDHIFNEVIFEELFKRYENDISFLVNSYYIFGYSSEDLKNECAFAFYRAIFSYDEGRNVKFRTYVLKVMRNHLSMILRRISVLFESKNKVCDLDFVLNVSYGNGDVCKEICSSEYIDYIKDNIIGDNTEDLLIFSAIIGKTTYRDLINSGRCSGNAYYKASKLISKIRRKVNIEDLK